MKEFRRIAIPPEAVARAIVFAIEQPEDSMSMKLSFAQPPAPIEGAVEPA